MIGGRERVPVRVFRPEHAHKVWRPTFFAVRVLRACDCTIVLLVTLVSEEIYDNNLYLKT